MNQQTMFNEAFDVENPKDEATPVDRLVMCRDCGCGEGQLHEWGCLQERCPFCGGQLATCMCGYKRLGLYDECRWTAATSFLPRDVYEHGMSPESWQQWLAICTEQGRYPYIQYPLFCAYCGEKWPELFMVPDDEWRSTVEPAVRNKILCRPCFDSISEQVTTARLGT